MPGATPNLTPIMPSVYGVGQKLTLRLHLRTVDLNSKITRRLLSHNVKDHSVLHKMTETVFFLFCLHLVIQESLYFGHGLRKNDSLLGGGAYCIGHD